MAEGFATSLKSKEIQAYSAGIETHGLNSNAVLVMGEVGIDISSQKSQNISEFKNVKFDYVVTVCGHADENCPTFLADSQVIHVGFDDPPKLALEKESDEEKLDCYRSVRDEICEFVKTIPKSFSDENT